MSAIEMSLVSDFTGAPRLLLDSHNVFQVETERSIRGSSPEVDRLHPLPRENAPAGLPGTGPTRGQPGQRYQLSVF